MTRPIRIVLALVAATGTASAQETLETAGEWAWTTITIQDGVRVSYVFYPEADSARGGVVLRLDNRNAYPVTYRFTAVFRSDGAEAEREAGGRIDARSIVTGAEPGLFFVPFDRGVPVGEIGIRRFRVEPVLDGDQGGFGHRTLSIPFRVRTAHPSADVPPNALARSRGDGMDAVSRSGRPVGGRDRRLPGAFGPWRSARMHPARIPSAAPTCPDSRRAGSA